MLQPGTLPDEDALVASSMDEAQQFADTARYKLGFDSPAMDAWAEHGGGLGDAHNLYATDRARAEMVSYVAQVDPAGAAWMDNTTIAAASTVIAEENLPLTPVNLWDLATWSRAVVCYERIYHHPSAAVDDDQINTLLDDKVLHPVELPDRGPVIDKGDRPEPYDGAIFRFINIWFEANTRLRQLSAATKHPGSIDDRALEAVRQGWATVLGRSDVDINDLLNWQAMSVEFRSPSHRLIEQITAASLHGNPAVFTPDRSTLPISSDEVAALIAETNLRSFLNRRYADDLHLPYERPIARMPFQWHLEATAAKVQQHLIAAQLLDDRYAELAEGAQLVLPAFLATAIQQVERSPQLWERLAEQRYKARKFRERRVELDRVLADRNLQQCAQVSKALRTDVERLHQLIATAAVRAGAIVLREMATGTPDQVSLGIAAATAAGNELLNSSLKDRIMWRLTRPHLLYLNNLVDESKQLTDAMPRVARVWNIAERDHNRFADHFAAIGQLHMS